MDVAVFLYIGTFFGFLCYSNEFYSVYEIFTFLRQQTKIPNTSERCPLNDLQYVSKLQGINTYTLRFRSCVFLANGFFVFYNYMSGLYVPLRSYIFYISIDQTLIIIRTYYAYKFKQITEPTHKEEMKLTDSGGESSNIEGQTPEMFETVQNPMINV